MFSRLELLSLDFMALLASVCSGDEHLFDVPGRHMFIAVAYIARYLILAVRAQLPVRDDVGRDRGMACNTILCLSLLVLNGAVGFDPFPVTSLKAIDLFKTQFFEFQCRPGTG